MGIKDLLRFMKPYITPTHIKKFSGKRVGIDAYSWLHKGAYSCSMELVMDPMSEKARQYLSYFMHRINLLRHYEVIPVVVFDGGNLPCKAATESERRRKREANHELAKEKLDQGDVTAAQEYFQRAVNITPEMAHQLIQILRMENVEYVVAPYEADAQLAYMSRLEADQGGLAAVITEDSDLIAYGCQCTIFKMDRFGNGEEIVMDNVLHSCQNGISFRNFDIELLTGMCVLAGCDFLSSVPGIGIKKAYNLVSKYKNLDRALSALKFDKKQEVPQDYVESFQKAVSVFHYARIYDYKSKSLKLMKPLPEKIQLSLKGDLDILGPDLPSSVAVHIAEGNLNPITKEAFDCSTKVDYHVKKTVFNSRGYRLVHVPRESRKESCFSMFSASQMSIKKIKGNEETMAGSIRYLDEALSLGKLIAPPSQKKAESEIEQRGPIPNNNPFKRKRLEEATDVCQSQSVEQGSTVTRSSNAEELISGLPESQESVNLTSVVISPTKISNGNKSSRTKSQPKAIMGKKNGILKFFRAVA